MYSENFDHVIPIKRRPEIMIPILLATFGIGLYSLIKAKKATNK